MKSKYLSFCFNFLAGSLLLFQACSGSETETTNPSEPNEPTLISEPAPPGPVFLVRGQGLRIRSTPGQAGEVLGKLDRGTLVQQTGAQSEKKEQIVIGGIEHNAYWIEVTAVEANLSGWIYASEDSSQGFVQKIWPLSGNETATHELILNSAISPAKVSVLLAVKGIRSYAHDGYAGVYEKNPQGKLEGSFFFAHLRNTVNRNNGAIYSGQFNNGKPVGIWKARLRENRREAYFALSFSEEGKCLERKYEEWNKGDRKLWYQDVSCSFDESSVETDI